MQKGKTIIGIGIPIIALGGVILFITIIALGLIILFNAGFPVLDPGITDPQLMLLDLERHSTLPNPSLLYINVSESQINQCSVLKTLCQELIENDQDSISIQLNNSEAACILTFLDSLSQGGIRIRWIYYQGSFFSIVFSTP